MPLGMGGIGDVSVSVSVLQAATMPPQHSVSLADPETPRSPHRNPAYMDSGMSAIRDCRSNQVTSPKPLNGTCPLRRRSRKPVSIHPAHLATPTAYRLHGQNTHVRVQADSLPRFSHARSVDPVFLGVSLHRPVVLRPTSATAIDRKPRPLQPFQQRPPCCVDGRCVLQRPLRNRKDTLQHLRLPAQELLDRTVTLSLVAGMARQREVRHSVGTALRPGDNMLHLQRKILRSAVNAATAPLLQQVFPDFVSVQPC